MSLHAIALLTVLTGFSATGTALQQRPDGSSRSGPGRETPHPESLAQVSLADLERADVLLETSTPEPLGSDRTSGSSEVPKGKVTDIVLFSEDGQIACAALSVGKILGSGERVVLVPATALKITTIENQPAYLLRLTKSEVGALPPFDVKKEGAEGLDRAVERARGLSSGAGGSAAKDGGQRSKESEGPGHARTAAKEASSAAAVPSYFLSSQLIDCPVNASDAEFGRLHDGAVDPGKNAVGYLLVSRSGAASTGVTMHAVPFSACRLTRIAGKSSLKLEKTGEELKAAPEYKKPEQGLLTPEQMKSADAFFGGGKSG